jgi:O-antigen biosynthesis protein
VKLLTVDLDRPLPDIEPPSIGEQWVLVRHHGEPLGMLYFPKEGCRAARLSSLINEWFAARILRHDTADEISGGGHDGCPQRHAYTPPSVTVAVCTRNGADRIGECLDALLTLDYPADKLDLLIVDNAPLDDRLKTLIGSRYPRLRYVVEPHPGLDRARNRAILEARGDIVAFTDDDVSVDPGWVDALARVFAAEPEVEAVTGLVVPDAIDCDAHKLFERYGGFGRGFDRRYFRVNAAAGERAADRHAGAGKFGTGANMAFRRSTFERIGLFDPGLDVGTPTNGGGDLEMFFRVLKSGGVLLYEPRALVRHRHRQTLAQLRTQLANNGIGFYAYLVRTARAYPDERRALLKLGISWFYWWNLRRLVRSFLRPDEFPRDLIVAEAVGSVVGLRRYTPVTS